MKNNNCPGLVFGVGALGMSPFKSLCTSEVERRHEGEVALNVVKVQGLCESSGAGFSLSADPTFMICCAVA